MERGFHQSLERHSDAFAAVVTGRTGFDGNPAVRRAVNGDLGIASALNRMHQCVAWFIVGDRFVVAFV